jgi:hypothetical protein
MLSSIDLPQLLQPASVQLLTVVDASVTGKNMTGMRSNHLTQVEDSVSHCLTLWNVSDQNVVVTASCFSSRSRVGAFQASHPCCFWVQGNCGGRTTVRLSSPYLILSFKLFHEQISEANSVKRHNIPWHNFVRPILKHIVANSVNRSI